jgi:hypothetical protein
MLIAAPCLEASTMGIQRPVALAMTLAVVTLAACSQRPERFNKIESLSFPDQEVLERRTAVSDGQPVTLGPYTTDHKLGLYAACLGGGRISVKVYAAQFTPNVFTNRHDGAVGYLDNGCNGRHWGTSFGDQPNTYCLVVSFEGKVTDYEVILTKAEVLGTSTTPSGPKVSATATIDPCHISS